jgi:hypothetical protein
MEAVVSNHRSKPFHADTHDAPASGHRKTPDNIIADVVAGMKQFSQHIGAEQRTILESVYIRMNFTLQKKIRPDLVNGAFQCQQCAVQGQRPTVPAYTYRVHPFHLIIPIRTGDDLALVQELEKGAMPRAEHHNGSGRGRGGRGGRGGGVQSGRITKARVEEKETVLRRIQNENLIEEIEALGL